jgi:hypothetical protein
MEATCALKQGVRNDLLRELVHPAVETGTHITLPGNLSNDLIIELTKLVGNHVTIVNN